MTEHSSDSPERSKNGQHRVGYGCPPSEHRFKKGVSGNPKGRPRKVADTLLYEEQIRALIQKEAYRTVTAHDGEKTERMPAIQAALRSMLVQGLKGKPQLLRQFIALVQETEGRRRDEKIKLIMGTFDYKETAYERREHCAKNGFPEPIIVPDPDDIHIDLAAGTVKVDGPITHEQKEIFERLREMKTDCELELDDLTRMLKDRPNDPELLKGVSQAQECLNRLSRFNL